MSLFLYNHVYIEEGVTPGVAFPTGFYRNGPYYLNLVVLSFVSASSLFMIPRPDWEEAGTR